MKEVEDVIDWLLNSNVKEKKKIKEITKIDTKKPKKPKKNVRKNKK